MLFALVLLSQHGGRRVSAAQPPHLVQLLVDDWGYFNAGWHSPGNPEVQTPHMDALVREGIELDRAYAFKYCSPSRCALQSGRNPLQVNVLNLDGPEHNPADPIGGWMGLPRNITGIATKLKSAGYRTIHVGKYDVGMGTAEHTPAGRGYDQSLIYFMHENDYWDDTSYYTCGKNATTIVDLWKHNETYAGGARALNQSWACSQSAQAGCAYVDDIFLAEVLAAINAHDTSTPLFLSWMPHGVHSPLEVPDAYLAKFAFIPDPRRRAYAAMVSHVDAMVGAVAAALKGRGMWDNLLWLAMADNGGPIYNNGSAGANNFPLRGGKGSNFEGGVRANAWAAGGLLPPSQRGRKLGGLVALQDFYATFCHLAGVDPFDARAAAAGLPPVDSVNQWPLLCCSSSNGTGPRGEVALGSAGLLAPWSAGAPVVQGLIQPPFKLLLGELGQNIWQSPAYPNETTSWPDAPFSCAHGCLYNIEVDPSEYQDLSREQPGVVARMRARMGELQRAVYSPNRGGDDGEACAAALGKWGGFWGPFEP
jgi:arylsulfatase B